jgi:ABC-2 type transport system permease protein
VNFLRALYAAFLRVAIAIELQYRASSVIWLLGVIVEPVIYLAVWSAVAEAQGGEIGGFGPHEFAAYYLVLTLVNQITQGWHMWEFQYRVQQGQFAFLLLRPVHPIHGDLAENLAHKAVMQVVLLPVLGALALVFAPRFASDPLALALFLPALTLAFALRFVVEWTLALACFWTTRIMA